MTRKKALRIIASDNWSAMGAEAWETLKDTAVVTPRATKKKFRIVLTDGYYTVCSFATKREAANYADALADMRLEKVISCREVI